jgi:hypothetical protein
MCTPNSLRFFNLYDKSLPENQTKRGEIDLFRTISKVLVYVFGSKRIDFRAILRNTLNLVENMGELSEFWEFLKSLNFGRLETVEFRPETLEFRSDISNLGTFLEHFWQSWNFGPFGVSSSSQQRIWYKFESYPYEKTTPDAGDGWARISLFKF